MLLRMLLILIAIAGLSLGGCKKEEPTTQDVMDQMKQDAEKAADDAADMADDMAKQAQDIVDEATE